MAVSRRFSPVFCSALRFGPRRLGRVARAAEQLDVRGIELGATVLQLDDVIAEDPAARPAAAFADASTLLQDGAHQGAPFLRDVERVCALGRFAGDAGVQHCQPAVDATQQCHDTLSSVQLEIRTSPRLPCEDELME